MRLYSIQLTADEAEIIVEALHGFTRAYPDSQDKPRALFVAEFLEDQLNGPNPVRGPEDEG